MAQVFAHTDEGRQILTHFSIKIKFHILCLRALIALIFARLLNSTFDELITGACLGNAFMHLIN